jgi:hypothetical protein
MPLGLFNPEISEAFTVAPEMVYSPIVPPLEFVTNRFDPETAMPVGLSSPEISEAFTVAPEVVYSPIVPLLVFVTNRFDPDTTMLLGPFNPEISEAFTVAPEMVYSPIVPKPGSPPTQLATKICPRLVAGIAQSAIVMARAANRIDLDFISGPRSR